MHIKTCTDASHSALNDGRNTLKCPGLRKQVCLNVSGSISGQNFDSDTLEVSQERAMESLKKIKSLKLVSWTVFYELKTHLT